MTTRILIILLALVTVGIQSVTWFLAYRDAERRHREAEELLSSLAIKIKRNDVQGCIPIAVAILKRAGLYVAPDPKKGPPDGPP